MASINILYDKLVEVHCLESYFVILLTLYLSHVGLNGIELSEADDTTTHLISSPGFKFGLSDCCLILLTWIPYINRRPSETSFIGHTNNTRTRLKDLWIAPKQTDSSDMSMIRQPSQQWLVQVCDVIFFLTRINLLDKRSSSFFLFSFLTQCLDFTFVIANISSDRALCKKVSKSESNFIVRFLNGWLDFFLPYVWYAWCTLGAHVNKAYQRILLLTLSYKQNGREPRTVRTRTFATLPVRTACVKQPLRQFLSREAN